MKQSIVGEKSFELAIRIVKLSNYLREEKHEFILSKQLLRSGTSIGANIREGLRGFSEADFVFKLSIAYKECDETCYWLELLKATGYLTETEFNSIYADAEEILKILTKIIKTSKTKKTLNS